MASLKWTLCLLYFYFKVIHTETKWTINVPNSIKGFPGSCVVIPCSFDFPSQKKEPKQFIGMWKDANNRTIYHPNDSEIVGMYQTRTRLLGNLRQKNCSLVIDPLKYSDKGPFHFMIDIDQVGKYSYTQNTVNISKDTLALSVKQTIKDGQTAKAFCSITHSCPTSPPVFTWSHLGREDIQQVSLKPGQLRTTSTLRFQPSREDHNKPLRCSISYKGGKQQNATSRLKVMYVPEIRNVSHCTSTAKLITCVCIVESNPPSRLQFVLSDRIQNSTGVKTNGTVTMALLQVQQRPYTFVQCLASSTLGRAQLILTVKLLHSTGITIHLITVAVGGGVLSLTLLMLATVVQKRRRTGAPQTSRLKTDNVVAFPQRMRKQDNVQGNEGEQAFSNNLYGNVETNVHEPLYINM